MLRLQGKECKGQRQGNECKGQRHRQQLRKERVRSSASYERPSMTVMLFSFYDKFAVNLLREVPIARTSVHALPMFDCVMFLSLLSVVLHIDCVVCIDCVMLKQVVGSLGV